MNIETRPPSSGIFLWTIRPADKYRNFQNFGKTFSTQSVKHSPTLQFAPPRYSVGFANSGQSMGLLLSSKALDLKHTNLEKLIGFFFFLAEVSELHMRLHT